MSSVGALGAQNVLPASPFTTQQATAELDSQQQAMSTLEQQISSGLSFSKPSDDPAGVVQAMRLSAALSRSQTYASTISSASGLVSQANNVLTQAGTQLQQLRTLVLQASNSTNQSAGDLAAYATQVTSIGTNIASGAATTYDGQPVFGETQQSRTVAPGVTTSVGVTASAAYGDSTSGINTVISKIASDLSSGAFTTGTTASDDLAALDSATSTLTNAAATVGVQAQTLQQYATQATTLQTSLTSQLGAVQNVDSASAVVALQQEQTDYQTSLWATTQILTPSLVKFLS